MWWQILLRIAWSGGCLFFAVDELLDPTPMGFYRDRYPSRSQKLIRLGGYVALALVPWSGMVALPDSWIPWAAMCILAATLFAAGGLPGVVRTTVWLAIILGALEAYRFEPVRAALSFVLTWTLFVLPWLILIGGILLIVWSRVEEREMREKFKWATKGVMNVGPILDFYRRKEQELDAAMFAGGFICLVGALWLIVRWWLS